MSISVFIVNYNTCDLLEQCLTSIFDTKGDLDAEVFVVDNNSNDGSSEMVKAKFHQVFLTEYSENMGFTKAINSVLPLAKGEYCLLLHPDIELPAGTLRDFVAFFEAHPKAGVLGGNLYYPDGTPNPCEIFFPGFKNDLLRFATRLAARLPAGGKLLWHFNALEWSHESTCQVNWVWNACMMVRGKVFEQIGYFDEDFFVWYADWDLCKRATDAGWLVYYLHPARAIHHERQSFAKNDTIAEEIRYKVDGWYSAAPQVRDRHVFLRKHAGAASVCGAKAICVTENLFRVWLIVGNLLFGKTIFKEARFQVRACLQSIQNVLGA